MKHYQRSYTHAIQTACTSRQGGRSVKVSVKICAEFFFMIERREGSSLWVYTQISQARESAYGPWIGHAFAKLITFSISVSNELGAMLHTFSTFHSGKKLFSFVFQTVPKTISCRIFQKLLQIVFHKYQILTLFLCNYLANLTFYIISLFIQYFICVLSTCM